MLGRGIFAEESLFRSLLAVRPNVTPECVNITETIDFPLYLNRARGRRSITAAASDGLCVPIVIG